jgi:hypothetical protein
LGLASLPAFEESLIQKVGVERAITVLKPVIPILGNYIPVIGGEFVIVHGQRSVNRNSSTVLGEAPRGRLSGRKTLIGGQLR